MRRPSELASADVSLFFLGTSPSISRAATFLNWGPHQRAVCQGSDTGLCCMESYTSKLVNPKSGGIKEKKKIPTKNASGTCWLGISRPVTSCHFSVAGITQTELNKVHIFLQVDTYQVLSKVLFKRAHFPLWYNVIVTQGERMSVNGTGCQRWHFKNVPQNGLQLPTVS